MPHLPVSHISAQQIFNFTHNLFLWVTHCPCLRAYIPRKDGPPPWNKNDYQILPLGRRKGSGGSVNHTQEHRTGRTSVLLGFCGGPSLGREMSYYERQLWYKIALHLYREWVVSRFEENENLHFIEVAAEAQGEEGSCPRSAQGPHSPYAEWLCSDVSNALGQSPGPLMRPVPDATALLHVPPAAYQNFLGLFFKAKILYI